MKAFLRFRNGDRREIELDSTQIRNGHPISTIRWQDGDDGLGGEKVGIREFWLDVIAYRIGVIRFEEVVR